MNTATQAVTNSTGKYLTFALHHQSYGIDVLKVREIIRVTNITAVPQLPAHVRGVINLRGKIIPVMDLRKRFGFPTHDDNNQTCIVVVQVPEGKTTAMGLVVDAVEEVINLNAADIEKTPDFGGLTDTGFILGIAKVKGLVKSILDIDGVVGAATPESMQPLAV